MYAILSGGMLIALCDKPRYVKLNEDSGAYVKTNKADAIGVSVRGKLYNINGGSAIADAPEAFITQGDISEYVFRNKVRIAENEEATNTAIIEVENALCDIDAAADEKLTAMEDALCELDSMLNREVKSNE